MRIELEERYCEMLLDIKYHEDIIKKLRKRMQENETKILELKLAMSSDELSMLDHYEQIKELREKSDIIADRIKEDFIY